MSDRQNRNRAHKCAPPKPSRCEVCGEARPLLLHHRNGFEEDNRPSNLQWICRPCNNRIAAEMVRHGEGRRTVQYNPGARNLAQYTEAALQHTRGAHDAGGKIIHETPKEKRQEFAAQIWRLRRARGTDRRH